MADGIKLRQRRPIDARRPRLLRFLAPETSPGVVAGGEEGVGEPAGEALVFGALAGAEELVGRLHHLFGAGEGAEGNVPGEEALELFDRLVVVGFFGKRRRLPVEHPLEDVEVGGDEDLAMGHGHGRIRKGGVVGIATEGTAGPVVVPVVAGSHPRRTGRLPRLVRHRLPDHMPADVDFPRLRLGRHAPGDRRGDRLRIIGFQGNEHPLAIGAEGENMVTGDHHGPAEMADEVVLDVDLWPVRIVFQARDHVVKHPLLANHVVDEGLEGPEHLGQIPLESEPAGSISRHPGGGGERSRIGKLEDPGGLLVAFLPAGHGWRGVDEGVVAEIDVPLAEEDDATGPLDAVEAVAACHLDVVGRLPLRGLLRRRPAPLLGLEEGERIDVPPPCRHAGGNGLAALPRHHLEGFERRQRILSRLGERREEGGDDLGARPGDDRAGPRGIGDPARSGGLGGHRSPLAGRKRRKLVGCDPLRGGEFLAPTIGEPLEDHVEKRGDGVVMAAGVDEEQSGKGAVGLFDRCHRRLAATDARELLRGDPETHPVAGDARPLLVEGVVKRLH